MKLKVKLTPAEEFLLGIFLILLALSLMKAWGIHLAYAEGGYELRSAGSLAPNLTLLVATSLILGIVSTFLSILKTIREMKRWR